MGPSGPHAPRVPCDHSTNRSLSRPGPVHILGREAGSAAAAQPLPPLFYCCSRAGRYPRLGSRGGGKQQAVGLACSSCLLASFRSILAQIPRRFLGVHHLAGARLFSRCFGAFVADDGEPSAPIRSATRLLHICLSPISLPLFCICFSFGPFPLQPLLISECFVTGLISWFLAGVCVCECNLFVISLALFACTGKGWIYDGWSIYLVRCGLLWRTYAQIYPSIHPCFATLLNLGRHIYYLFLTR